MKVLCGITELIGNTPLLKCDNIYAKLECKNPSGSIKDRAVFAMIELALTNGNLSPGGSVIMATNGAAGVSLTAICASMGLKAVIIGADEGMKNARKTAKTLAESTINAVFLDHFEDEMCVAVHRDYTGVEIWADMDGEIDVFVAGVGTGATITGVATLLKSKNPNIEIFAVEPSESPVLSGGKAGIHDTHGIGAGFVPKFYEPKLVDGILTVSAEEAREQCDYLRDNHGLSVGISSGAVFAACKKLTERAGYLEKKIVTIFPS
jgi:cysteine synthase A